MKVLITGGTGGIGSEIVKKFRSHGHDVYAPTRQELDLATDFILPDNKFDIIINNAGINPLKQIHEITDLNVLQVNYVAPQKIISQCIEHMINQKYGRIINIGSIWIDDSKPKRAAYSASKSALHSLTKSITSEYAQYNILANTISPGFIATELTFKNNTPDEIKKLEENIPLKRLGIPKEIAILIYHMTIENSYISGQNIIIDGGYLCSRY